MALDAGQQVVKTRDDNSPTLIDTDSAGADSTKPYRLAEDSPRAWQRAARCLGPRSFVDASSLG